MKKMVKKETFWNDMDRILNKIWNGYRLCILGDLNGWIGDRTRASISGAFGVLGENDNGRRVGICMWIIHTLNTGVYVSTQRWQRVKMV